MPEDHDRRGRRGFLALCGAAALAGCASAPTAPSTTRTASEAAPSTTTAAGTTVERGRSFPGAWPAFGANPANTGRGSGSLAARDRLWVSSVPGIYTLNPPAVTATSVVIGSKKRLFAFDRGTGLPTWEYDMGAFAHQFTPSVRPDRGTLVAAARGFAGTSSGSDSPGTLAALATDTGDALWRKAVPVSGSVRLVGDRIVYPAATRTRGFVVARSLADGSELWRHEVGDGQGGAFGTPALVDGTLYATGVRGAGEDASGVLAALDPTTGDERWTHDFDAPVKASPSVSAGAAVVATEAGDVASVDLASRERKWTVSSGDQIFARPSVTETRAFAISKGVLTAVDRTAGEVAWTGEIGANHFSTTSVADGVVYVGGPTLYAYGVTDGREVFAESIPGWAGAYGGPVVVNGTMYVGACVKSERGDLYDNYVYALGSAPDR